MNDQFLLNLPMLSSLFYFYLFFPPKVLCNSILFFICIFNAQFYLQLRTLAYSVVFRSLPLSFSFYCIKYFTYDRLWAYVL